MPGPGAVAPRAAQPVQADPGARAGGGTHGDGGVGAAVLPWHDRAGPGGPGGHAGTPPDGANIPHRGARPAAPGVVSSLSDAAGTVQAGTAGTVCRTVR
eukprot:158371-Hanusia_phi.AAC.1